MVGFGLRVYGVRVVRVRIRVERLQLPDCGLRCGLRFTVGFKGLGLRGLGFIGFKGLGLSTRSLEFHAACLEEV